MWAACLRIGGLLNKTELGRDIGINQPQVHRFLNLMETSFQVIRLAAYAVNRTKRLIKAAKLYWCDTALALHLTGGLELRGAHLENLVLMDLLAWRDTQARKPEVLYWRTATGEEVDLVIETPSRTIPIEVKTGTRLGPADARGLESFLDEARSFRAASYKFSNGGRYWDRTSGPCRVKQRVGAYQSSICEAEPL